jgi:hypothetical protein
VRAAPAALPWASPRRQGGHLPIRRGEHVLAARRDGKTVARARSRIHHKSDNLPSITVGLANLTGFCKTAIHGRFMAAGQCPMALGNDPKALEW